MAKKQTKTDGRVNNRNMDLHKSRPEAPYVKYRPYYAEQVYAMCLAGYTRQAMFDLFGVDQTTFDAWRRTHRDFKNAYDRGMTGVTLEVVQKYANAAMGKHRTVKRKLDTKGNVLDETIEEVEGPSDIRAMERWLAVHLPDKFAPKAEPAQPTVSITQITATMTPMQAAELYHRMLANPGAVIEGNAKQIKGNNE